ncbi:MAG: protein archease [Deltaproteobacteria bacterium HGW-Deltaproteobacteria-1]|jgi:SHS2 domain-containing protein|nr:MAG: protein archease [Deltaproteobacteria bacterium HGW-Deltaproteobacteria-1]
MLSYTLFDHTADIGVEILGRTKKELFAHAAHALFDIMIQTTFHKNRKSRGGKGRQLIKMVDGADVEDLFINFLRELLYLFNGKRWVVDHCEMIECSNTRLIATLWVEPYNKKKHSMKTEIKAVTYSGLSVKKFKSGWMARLIFDV